MKPENIPSPEEFRHHCPVQVRFNDIDILGHLNNTVYFSFFDTGKAYYFQDVKQGSMNWKRVDTVIANVNCAYLNSIVFGENIEVYTRCLAVYEKSFRLQQMLVRMPEKTVMAVCETIMVSFDPAKHISTPLSAEWIEALEKYENKNLRNH